MESILGSLGPYGLPQQMTGDKEDDHQREKLPDQERTHLRDQGQRNKDQDATGKTVRNGKGIAENLFLQTRQSADIQ